MIRPADTNDSLLLAALIREAFRDVAQRLNLRPSSAPTHPSNCAPAWIESAITAGARFYIDLQHGAPAGCVAIELPDRRAIGIDRLCVLPQYRRKGIGSSLVQRALDEARLQNAGLARIRIPETDEQARRWLEDQGFRAEEIEHYPYLPYNVTRMEIPIPTRERSGAVRLFGMRMDDYDEALALWEKTENLGPPPGRDSLERFLKHNPGMSLVARIDGELVGAILGGHDGRVGDLGRLAIARDHRRKGIGRMLTAESLKRMREDGIQRFHTMVFAENNASIHLMKSLGFEVMDNCIVMGVSFHNDSDKEES